MNALELHGLEKHYPDFALGPIDLELPGGTVCGLIGENGAGKSTTIKLILDMIDREAGTVKLFGQEEITPLAKADIGVVMGGEGIPTCLTAPQVGKVMAGIYPNWDAAAYADWCRRFDLPENKKYGDYSTGMKMKQCLAVALSHHPKLLLLDEATSGLDPVVRELVKKLLVDFVAENGASVMIASHNLRELEDVCDHVGLLHRGGALCEDDLDRLKLGITRVQFALADPADFETVRAGLNLLKCSQQGKLFEMTVRGTETETLALVQRLHPLFCETLPITLEELFISEMGVAGYDINKVI